MKKISVLMVCTANICRSPMAEGLLLLHAERAGLRKQIVVQSAGTRAAAGQRPDPRAERAAAAAGVDLCRMRSRPLQPGDYVKHDYLIGMDAGHRQFLRDACPAEHAHKLALIMDFAPEAGVPEVPDPYFGNYAGFERVLGLLDLGVAGLLRQLREQRFL